MRMPHFIGPSDSDSERRASSSMYSPKRDWGGDACQCRRRGFYYPFDLRKLAGGGERKNGQNRLENAINRPSAIVAFPENIRLEVVNSLNTRLDDLWHSCTTNTMPRPAKTNVAAAVSVIGPRNPKYNWGNQAVKRGHKRRAKSQKKKVQVLP